MKARLGFLIVVIVMLSIAVCGTAYATDVALSLPGGYTVYISLATGQISYLRSPANLVIQSSQDVYDYGTGVAYESNDQMWAYSLPDSTRATFACTNSGLPNGIQIWKGYHVVANSAGTFDLIKTVWFYTNNSTKTLLKVGSQTILQNDRYVYNDPGSGWYDANYPASYYYMPMDDGYRNGSQAGYPGPLCTLADMGGNGHAWGSGYGRFVYHVPYYAYVFAHYRNQLNGTIVGNDMTNGQYAYTPLMWDDIGYGQPDGTNHQTVSKWVTGGAVTFLGQEYVSSSKSLTIESIYTCIPGDPRDYHKYMMAHHPYVDYASAYTSSYPVPAWMKNCRMYMGYYVPADLINNPSQIANDMSKFQSLLRSDQYIMGFIPIWGKTGDYPYASSATNTYAVPLQDPSSTWRQYWNPLSPAQPYQYQTYTNSQLKTGIATVKAAQAQGKPAGHVKFGGYEMAHVDGTTYPYSYGHNGGATDWFVYSSNGTSLLYGGTNVWDRYYNAPCPDAFPDFGGGYTAYALDNYNGLLRAQSNNGLGWDWLHIDYSMAECINYNPYNKHAVQPGDASSLYRSIGYNVANNVAGTNPGLVRNSAPEAAWWSPASEWEPYDFDLSIDENKNWRSLANAGYLAGWYRTNRPGVWTTHVYGARGLYGKRGAMSGLKGWIRGQDLYLNHIWQALGYEKIADELLQTKISSVRVTISTPTVTTPTSWWLSPKNNNMDVEAEAYQTGDNTLIIPMLKHQTSQANVKMSFTPSGYSPSNVTFGYDLKVTLGDCAVDSNPAYTPLPWSQDYMQMTNCTLNAATTDYNMGTLDVLRNYYHVVSQVPAFVYALNNGTEYFRTSLPLTYLTPTLPDGSGVPTTRQVSVAGSYPTAGASSYALTVTNDSTYPVQIMAYVPSTWTYVSVTGTGVTVNGKYTLPGTKNFLLLTVPYNTTSVTLSSGGTNYSAQTYVNPQEMVWTEATGSIFNSYGGAYNIGVGVASIYLNQGAWATMQYSPDAYATATGINIWIWKNSSADQVQVQLCDSGGTWHSYTVQDSYTGTWRQYTILLSQMTPSVSSATISAVQVKCLNAGNQQNPWICVKDFALTP